MEIAIFHSYFRHHSMNIRMTRAFPERLSTGTASSLPVPRLDQDTLADSTLELRLSTTAERITAGHSYSEKKRQ